MQACAERFTVTANMKYLQILAFYRTQTQEDSRSGKLGLKKDSSFDRLDSSILERTRTRLESWFQSIRNCKVVGLVPSRVLQLTDSLHWTTPPVCHTKLEALKCFSHRWNE